MKLTEFISDVGRPIAYYPGLKKITKSTTATILLCQLIYWTGKQADPDGWIYKTSTELEEETGLTYDEQKTARAQLVKLGFIEDEYRRLDHQLAFRIMKEPIDAAWEIVNPGNGQSRNTQMVKAVTPKWPTGQSHDGQSRNTQFDNRNTETTAQNTQENTTDTHTAMVVSIFKLYENTVGMVTPMMADELKQAEIDYPGEWIPEAFLLAEKANVRKWSYIRAILDRWKTDGRGAPSKTNKITMLEPILE